MIYNASVNLPDKTNLINSAGISRGTSVRYAGKNVKEAMKAISKKMKKKYSGESLSTIPDPKECIACKTVSFVSLYNKCFDYAVSMNSGTESFLFFS